MKRLLIFALLCCLLAGTALAQSLDIYTLSPAAINEEGLQEVTFGVEIGIAQIDKSRDYLFVSLDNEGPPFCGYDPIHYAPKSDVSIMRLCSQKQPHEEGIYENVEPSGIARTAITREDALNTARVTMEKLGIQDYVLQSVVAYGKLPFTAPSYKVSFGQAIGGLPVYWAAPPEGMEQTNHDSNRAQIVVGDCGLYSLQMMWSDMTPQGTPKPALPLEEALAAFAALGIPADTLELCYLLRPENGQHTATPAWRWQNSFLHAITGEWMQ